MDEVRIGIIGIGGMGGNHARSITRGGVPGARLTAVCDIRPERLQWAAEELDDAVRRFDTAEELLTAGDLDGVLIATPHYLHPPLAIRAFECGLHVLTEKPAGVYTRQVREMNEAAEASGKVFAIMFQQRTQGAHRKVRDLVQSGELGDLKRVIYIITSWYRPQSYYDAGGWRATWAGEGGGVLLNQCPHQLDLWQWFMGMPRRVRAFMSFGKYHDIEVEDDVTAYVEYANGASGVFVASTAEAPGTNRLEISGSRGRLVLEGGKLVFDRTRIDEREFNRSYRGGFGSPEKWRCDIPVPGGGGGHMEICRNWVDVIRKGRGELIAPGEEGIKGLSLSNAMMLSAWQDRWVDLPVDEDAFYGELKPRIEASSYTVNEANRAMDTEGTY